MLKSINNKLLKNLVLRIKPIITKLAWPVIIFRTISANTVRMVVLQSTYWLKEVLLTIAIFPIRNHRYKPQFTFGVGNTVVL
jgi:hypothetical protein